MEYWHLLGLLSNDILEVNVISFKFKFPFSLQTRLVCFDSNQPFCDEMFEKVTLLLVTKLIAIWSSRNGSYSSLIDVQNVSKEMAKYRFGFHYLMLNTYLPLLISKLCSISMILLSRKLNKSYVRGGEVCLFTLHDRPELCPQLRIRFNLNVEFLVFYHKPPIPGYPDFKSFVSMAFRGKDQ
jgi:hypothetical protein